MKVFRTRCPPVRRTVPAAVCRDLHRSLARIWTAASGYEIRTPVDEPAAISGWRRSWSLSVSRVKPANGSWLVTGCAGRSAGPAPGLRPGGCRRSASGSPARGVGVCPAHVLGDDRHVMNHGLRVRVDLDHGDLVGVGVGVGVERKQARLIRLDGGVAVVGKPGLELLELARLHLVGSDEDEWCSHDGLLGEALRHSGCLLPGCDAARRLGHRHSGPFVPLPWVLLPSSALSWMLVDGKGPQWRTWPLDWTGLGSCISSRDGLRRATSSRRPIGWSLWRPRISSFAEAAQVLGRGDKAIRLLRRAYRARVEAGEVDRAITSAFWLWQALIINRSSRGRTAGWRRSGVSCRNVEKRAHGEGPWRRGEPGTRCDRRQWLAPGDRRIFARRGGRLRRCIQLLARAAAVASRHGQTDLVAFATTVWGRALIKAGRLQEGLSRLDEAMVAVIDRDTSPRTTSLLYCSAIATCHEVREFARAREWTLALGAWLDTTPRTRRCLLRQLPDLPVLSDVPVR